MSARAQPRTPRAPLDTQGADGARGPLLAVHKRPQDVAFARLQDVDMTSDNRDTRRALDARPVGHRNLRQQEPATASQHS